MSLDLNSTVNGLKQDGRMVYHAPETAEKTDEEKGYTGITWNGYRLPLGVRLTDGGGAKPVAYYAQEHVSGYIDHPTEDEDGRSESAD